MGSSGSSGGAGATARHDGTGGACPTHPMHMPPVTGESTEKSTSWCALLRCSGSAAARSSARAAAAMPTALTAHQAYTRGFDASSRMSGSVKSVAPALEEETASTVPSAIRPAATAVARVSASPSTSRASTMFQASVAAPKAPSVDWSSSEKEKASMPATSTMHARPARQRRLEVAGGAPAPSAAVCACFCST